jgi:phosphoglycolate phosphatase-like HAD superfamily hydrolase
VTKLVLDRDGTLFDTCELNFQSYLEASKTLEVEVNRQALQESICGGESFSTFHLKVWGNSTSMEREAIRNFKSEYFSRNLDLARLNPEIMSQIGPDGESVFLATRATLESTYLLLDHFAVRIQRKNVYSTQNYPGDDKVSIMQTILKLNGGLPASVKLIDDSVDTINKVSELGFDVLLYPHYCSFGG